MLRNSLIISAFIGVSLLFGPISSYGQVFSSPGYQVLDPVLAPSAFSTSTGFQLWSSVGEIGIGTSTAPSFATIGGFLPFPKATSPTVSASAGAGFVNLSWTISSGFLGWTPSSYSVGQATVSGGPYTFTNVGNVTSSNRTGLTGGTTYYFVIRVNDFFGNVVATSSEISATPTSSSAPGGGGGGGGGGGFGGTPASSSGTASISVSGNAYPNSRVFFYQNGREILRTVSGPDANFAFSRSGLTPGSYTFSVVAVDNENRRSPAFPISVALPDRGTTSITGVFLAPILSVQYDEIRRGDTVTFFGKTVPEASVTLEVNSKEQNFFQVNSNDDGVYLVQFNSSILETGRHHAKSQAEKNFIVSPFSNLVAFRVGTETISRTPVLKGDLNKGNDVNLYDFSIAAYWYKRTLSEAMIQTEREHLNGDGVIDLVDFSIIAYYWTE